MGDKIGDRSVDARSVYLQTYYLKTYGPQLLYTLVMWVCSFQYAVLFRSSAYLFLSFFFSQYTISLCGYSSGHSIRYLLGGMQQGKNRSTLVIHETRMFKFQSFTLTL